MENTKETSIYTSYVKDVFIELLKADETKSKSVYDLMSIAVELIKQARGELYENGN